MKSTKTLFQAGAITLIALSSCKGESSELNTPVAAAMASPLEQKAQDEKRIYVNILIEDVELLGDIGDADGVGELQFVAIVSDENGRADGLVCPFYGTMSVRTGDKVKPCRGGLTYREDDIAGNLYVVLIAVDQDNGGILADLGTEGLSALLSYGLGQAITAGLGLSGPLGASAAIGFIALDTLIGYSGNLAQDYFEQEDVIGEQSFMLSKDYHWASGQIINEYSTNQSVKFSFLIDRSSSIEGKIVSAEPQTYKTLSTQIPTETPKDPTEFIRWYFTSLWQDRNYKHLWDNYLTSSFKNHSSPGGYKEYVDWWDSVVKIDINSVKVIENNGGEAWVRVNMNFHLRDGRILQGRNYDYTLTYKSEHHTWMFDYHY